MESVFVPHSNLVELISGADAHPETADVLLMPISDKLNQVKRNDELGTEVRVAAGLHDEDNRGKSWLIGYMSSDTSTEISPDEQYELARAFICKQGEDPNGFYAEDIYNLLLEKAAEGHIASEVNEFLNEKVLRAKENLKMLKFESVR
jgi:hypothetical protein